MHYNARGQWQFISHLVSLTLCYLYFFFGLRRSPSWKPFLALNNSRSVRTRHPHKLLSHELNWLRIWHVTSKSVTRSFRKPNQTTTVCVQRIQSQCSVLVVALGHLESQPPQSPNLSRIAHSNQSTSRWIICGGSDTLHSSLSISAFFMFFWFRRREICEDKSVRRGLIIP